MMTSTAADATASQLDAMSIDDSTDDPATQSQSRRRNGGGEARESAAPPSSSSSYLTPLQQSLVFELTTRRTRIAAAQQRVDFWRAQDDADGGVEGAPSQQFGRDVVDAAFVDNLIQQRKAKLTELQQAQKLKEAIIASADAAHSINASMAAVPPAPFSKSSDTPLCVQDGPREQQPLRSLTARRDELALQFLRLHEQVKELRKKRRENAREIYSIREETSTLARQVQQGKASLQELREAEISADVSRLDGMHQRRVEELREAIVIARGKREMVKGVLRGIILESGLDWYGSKRMRALVMSLADEDLNSSDEEIHLFSDEEQDEESDEYDEDDNDDEEETSSRDDGRNDGNSSHSPIIIDDDEDEED